MSRLPREKKIRIQMIIKGISGAEIARRLGTTRATVWRTIDSMTRGKRVRAGIAEALDIPYEYLWGEDVNENEKEVA